MFTKTKESLPEEFKVTLIVGSQLDEEEKEGEEEEATWRGKTAKPWTDKASMLGIATGYCFSASLLSIINKWALTRFPYPGSLTALQYFTSCTAVVLLGKMHVLDHDCLDWKRMIRFLPAAVLFYLSLFTNSELLLNSNVDTFIVFRSAVPIFVAVGETLYLKQPWPSSQAWFSLAVIFGGTLVYVLAESRLALTTYSWAFAYLATMSIDLVYIKHIVATINLNTWGLVLYNNLEALFLFPLELWIMGEGYQLSEEKVWQSKEWLSSEVWIPVSLSCAFGLSISFFGFACRKAISATSFTVLGVVNKLLTVVINLFIWDKHASLIGTLGLLTCIGGGIFYQRSIVKLKYPPSTQGSEQEKLIKHPK